MTPTGTAQKTSEKKEEKDMAQKNEEEPITKLEIDKSRRKLDFTE